MDGGLRRVCNNACAATKRGLITRCQRQSMPRCPRGAGSVAGTTDPLRSNACYTGSQRRRGSRLRQFLAIRGSWSRLVALSHGTSWDSAASPTADGCSAICEAGAGRRGLPTPPTSSAFTPATSIGARPPWASRASLSPIVHSTSPALAAPRARVAGGAEEPLLARHIRSSKRRRQDAYATPRRRRTRTRSRRLSLRLRERLCSPARTPRCRSSSVSRVPDAWTDCVMALAFAHGGRRAAS